jgi:hypothetical protein
LTDALGPAIGTVLPILLLLALGHALRLAAIV